MINLENIKFKNILSYGDEMSEFRLDNEGITLITGGNGKGKSTILEAINFALYGVSLRGVNKGQIINDRNNKDGYVELDLNDGKDSYKIIRTLKPDSVSIYQNGSDKPLNEESKPTLTQALINDIIRVNTLMFTQLTLQSKTSYVPFLGLKPEHRRKFIDSIFSLDVYRKMTTINNDNLKEVKKLHNTKLGEIDNIKLLVNKSKEHIESLTNLKNQSVLSAETRFNKDVSEAKEYLEKLSKDAKSVNDSLKDIDEIVEFHDNSEILSRIEGITKIMNDIEYNGKELAKLIHFFEHNEECPTCKQYLNPNFRKSKIETLNEEKELLKPNYVEHKKSVAEQRHELNEINEKNRIISENKHNVKTLKERLTELRKDYKLQKAKLDEIIKVGLVVINYDDDIDKAKLDLVESENNLLNKENELENISFELFKAEQSAKILVDSGIIATVIDEFIPMINDLINKYLGIMGIDMVFELDKNFKDTIYKLHGKPTSYDSLSEGEKLRINLSTLLAWRDIATLQGMNYINVLFFDEMFDSSMDQNGIDAFLEILYNMENLNIFIISHVPSKINADHSYVVDKINDFSVIRKEK